MLYNVAQKHTTAATFLQHNAIGPCIPTVMPQWGFLYACDHVIAHSTVTGAVSMGKMEGEW